MAALSTSEGGTGPGRPNRGWGTGPGRGRELYDFIRRESPRDCLELGFAHGVSTVYIAAGLEANGSGRLTSVDLDVARERVPPAQQLVERAGLGPRVELIYEPVSYNWYLQRRIREQVRDGDVCAPCLDF